VQAAGWGAAERDDFAQNAQSSQLGPSVTARLERDARRSRKHHRGVLCMQSPAYASHSALGSALAQQPHEG
jgi:hypothetical protein